MNIDEAREATETLEDVFVRGDAVVISGVHVSTETGTPWVRVTGGGQFNPYFMTWVRLDEVSSTAEVMAAGEPTYNPYAQALADGRYAKLWLCNNCTIVLANGDASGVGEDDPEPLNKITSGDLTLGLLDEDHADTCTPEDRESGCDCGHRTFDWSTCDGCGDLHAGERHAALLVYVTGR